eukprot:9647266-Lingulodinium_polyedra.AAC.1
MIPRPQPLLPQRKVLQRSQWKVGLDFGCSGDPWQCVEMAARALAIFYGAFASYGLRAKLEP